MFSFVSCSFRPLGGWRYIWLLLLGGQFSPLKMHKISTKTTSLPFFYFILLRSKVAHMRLIVAEEQAFVSRKVSFYLLFVLYFFRIYETFSHQKQTLFFCFLLACYVSCNKTILLKKILGFMFSWSTTCPLVGGHHVDSTRLITVEICFSCSLWYLLLCGNSVNFWIFQKTVSRNANIKILAFFLFKKCLSI